MLSPGPSGIRYILTQNSGVTKLEATVYQELNVNQIIVPTAL